MARTFDLWLPYIEPVADRLIDRLDLKPGMKVLDVACGTGEPGLSIARRWKGQVEVIGIDAAEAMVEVCRQKAAYEGLKGITHLVMKAEELEFLDDSFNRVICRFGVMLFDDLLKGLCEMYRTLKRRGRMTFAVWSSFDKIESAAIPFRLLAQQFPENDQPPEPKMASLGQQGKLEELIKKAHIGHYKIEPIRLTYTFNNPEEFWQLVIKSGFSKEHYERFTEDKIEAWHQGVISALASCQKNNKIILSNEALTVIIKKDGRDSPVSSQI